MSCICPNPQKQHSKYHPFADSPASILFDKSRIINFPYNIYNIPFAAYKIIIFNQVIVHFREAQMLMFSYVNVGYYFVIKQNTQMSDLIILHCLFCIHNYTVTLKVVCCHSKTLSYGTWMVMCNFLLYSHKLSSPAVLLINNRLFIPTVNADSFNKIVTYIGKLFCIFVNYVFKTISGIN